MTIVLKRKAKVASLSPAKLATKLIASRQLVFFASVKHCFFKVSACSPERKVHKMFRITLKISRVLPMSLSEYSANCLLNNHL